MSIWENIKIAVFSIRTNMMRSILTMLGIIIGVASVIAIITVGNGGKDYIVDIMSDMSSGAVSIQVSTKASDTEKISKEDIESIKNLDTVKYVSPIDYQIGTSTTDSDTYICLAVSGNADLKNVMKVTMKKGRFFTAEENKNGSNVCIISDMGAELYFGGIENSIGQYVNFKLNGQSTKFRIIGVTNSDLSASASASTVSSSASSMTSFYNSDEAEARGMGGDMMMTLIFPVTVMERMTSSNGYGMVYVMAHNQDDASAVGNAAKNILYARHSNFGSRIYSVVNMETYTVLVDKIINVFTTFVAGISAIALLVGGIGVMNIMLVSVTERTREIGIRKALGAKTSTIMLQFLTESIILCLIGGIIGFILGVGMAAVVAHIAGITIKIEASTIAIAVGFSSAVGIFFGLYPARKAAKMLPIDALRRD